MTFEGDNVGKNLYEKKKNRAQIHVSKHFQKIIKNISKMIFEIFFLQLPRPLSHSLKLSNGYLIVEAINYSVFSCSIFILLSFFVCVFKKLIAYILFKFAIKMRQIFETHENSDLNLKKVPKKKNV